MRVGRWALVPAVFAAAGTTVAIAPIGGAPARGVRVEVAEGAAANRPVLLRLALEEAKTRFWRAPSMARVTVRAANGASSAVDASSTEPRAPWLLLRTAPIDAPPPYAVHVSAEGFHARFTVQASDAPRAFVPPARGAADHGLRLAVEGGALVPEVPSVVLARVENAPSGATLSPGPYEQTLVLSPERAPLDACGVAVLYARLSALDARVRFITPTGLADRRLPVAPGAMSSRIEEGAIVAASPNGGVLAYILAGDLQGATWWTLARLPTSAESFASRSVALPPDVRWAVASASSEFEQRSGGWTVAPPTGSEGCATTALGLRFARVSTPTPAPPRLRLAFDGASEALSLREGRKRKVRAFGLLLTAFSLAALATLMLRAAKAVVGSEKIDGVSANEGRSVVLAGIVALGAAAIALFATALLRA